MPLEDKICIWYGHYKKMDVMGETMMRLYNCNKCDGYESECKGYFTKEMQERKAREMRKS